MDSFPCPICRSLTNWDGLDRVCVKTDDHKFEPPWHLIPEERRTCRECKKLVSERFVTFGYWWGRKFACHKECKEKNVTEEAIACQTVDADCNDCKWFKRGKMIAKGVFEGECLKFNQLTKAYPKMFTGRPCFEHRKS